MEKSQGKPVYNSVISWAVIRCLGYTVTPFRVPRNTDFTFTFSSLLASVPFLVLDFLIRLDFLARV